MEDGGFCFSCSRTYHVRPKANAQLCVVTPVLHSMKALSQHLDGVRTHYCTFGFKLLVGH
jgi:hypothetical protein